MTRTTNNTNKASGDASPFRRQNHPKFADDALISLLIRGQLSSSSVTADRIQRNSGTSGHSGTYVRRSGLVEAMEELIHHTSRDSPNASPTTSPRGRVRYSLNPDSGATRRRDMGAILSEACRLVEACQLVEDDDESGDL
jgi:hypothetical protein